MVTTVIIKENNYEKKIKLDINHKQIEEILNKYNQIKELFKEYLELENIVKDSKSWEEFKGEFYEEIYG